jgi:FtsP/CotA-like multicopper oxidase with cupredoxin domain
VTNPWIRCASAAHAIAWLAAAAAAQSTVDFTLTARPAAWTLHSGRVVDAWTFDGTLPGPTLRAAEGDTVRVRVVNELPEKTSVHWHGIPNTVLHDSVPQTSGVVIEPGQEHTYVFRALPAGTYWYHPHVGMQLERGLYGMLIVDPLAPDPVAHREYAIVLDDWIDPPLAMVPQPAYSEHLINGRSSLGQAALAVAQGETVRLRLLNAAAATNYVVAVQGHSMTVIRADGQPVVPVTRQAIPIGMGERYDVLVAADHPGIWSIAASSLTNRNVTLVRAVLEYAGSTGPWPSPSLVPSNLSSGTLLAYSHLAAAGPVQPISPAPDRIHDIELRVRNTGQQPEFLINGEAWPNTIPLDVALGERVRFDVTNMSGMYHPMHVHGHFFRLLGSAGGTSAPLVKDTVLVPPMMGTLDAELTADNPGSWLYHCHHSYHMEMGMMALVRYVGTDTDGDGVPDERDFDPLVARPVLQLDSLGHGFAVGTAFEARVQWVPGQNVTYVIGPELVPATPFGALGELHVGQRKLLGRAQVATGGTSTLAATIPNLPAWSGGTFAVQALARHPTLAGGARFSTFELVHVP